MLQLFVQKEESFEELDLPAEVKKYFDNLALDGPVVLVTTKGHDNSKSWKAILGKFWRFIHRDQKLAQNLAEAEKELAELQAQMMKAKSPSEMVQIADKMKAAQKIIDNKGKKGGTRSGDSDRSNPLPKFESSNAIFRGFNPETNEITNGKGLVAVRTDALQGKTWKDAHLADGWQVFEHKGDHWQWLKAAGKHTSWSGLNQFLHNHVLGKDGQSIGVSHLLPCSNDKLVDLQKSFKK